MSFRTSLLHCGAGSSPGGSVADQAQLSKPDELPSPADPALPPRQAVSREHSIGRPASGNSCLLTQVVVRPLTQVRCGWVRNDECDCRSSLILRGGTKHGWAN